MTADAHCVPNAGTELFKRRSLEYDAELWQFAGGEAARLYTICGGGITAGISDFGATLVRLLVPDRNGRAGDVALGFDTAGDYLKYGGCLGATVGRNANRVGGSCLNVGEKTVRLTPNEGPNNLHSGPDYWYHRMWMVDRAHGKRHHPGAGDAGWRPGFPRRGTGGSDLCADRRRSAHHLSGDL